MKFSISRLFCLLALALLLSPTLLRAQSLSSEDIRTQYVNDWTRAKAYTMDYLKTMPADKYSFRAVDSIRSFAQQMLHLAQASFYLMSNATGGTMPNFGGDLEKRASAQTMDSVTYYVGLSYDFCINAVKNFDVKKWGEKTKIFGMEVTRFALMIKTFEHQTHHRGQTTIYIRLQGIKPPDERLF